MLPRRVPVRSTAAAAVSASASASTPPSTAVVIKKQNSAEKKKDEEETSPPPPSSNITPSRNTTTSLVQPPLHLTSLHQVSAHVQTALAYENHHLPLFKTVALSQQRIVTPASFHSDAITTARWLLGSRLVRVLPCGTRLSGRIVECEAYVGPLDRGAHSYGGRRTERTEMMFCAGGISYIYLIYGMYSCLNIISSKAGDPTGVLIRGIEPEDGLEHMLKNRVEKRNKKKLEDLTQAERDKLIKEGLCAGPGRLCMALDLDKRLNAVDLLTHESLFLEHGEHVPAEEIMASPRIGIDYAGPGWKEAPLRFSITGNRHVSKPWPWVRKGKKGKEGGRKVEVEGEVKGEETHTRARTGREGKEGGDEEVEEEKKKSKRAKRER